MPHLGNCLYWIITLNSCQQVSQPQTTREPSPTIMLRSLQCSADIARAVWPLDVLQATKSTIKGAADVVADTAEVGRQKVHQEL